MTSGRGFVEHFRLDATGRFEETQYQLVSREDAYGARETTTSEGYWAAQGDNGFVSGRSYYPAQGWQQGPPQPAAPQPSLPQPLRGLFAPLFGDFSESEPNGVRRDPDYFWGKRTNRFLRRLKKVQMRISCPIALSGFMLICSFSAAGAQDFRVEDVTGFRDLEVAQLAPGTIAVSDDQKSAGGDATKLISFQEWVRTQPEQKKFLSLFPSYAEPTVTKVASAGAVRAPVTEKLTMYVARARFIINRSPGAIDLSHYVTFSPFLRRLIRRSNTRSLPPPT